MGNTNVCCPIPCDVSHGIPIGIPFPWTSLQIFLPISGKVSITNYLKQYYFDYEGHLTIENKLKVERILYFQIKVQLLPPKKRFG